MLHLAFPDKYTLWGDLIHPGAERIFVPTRETHRIGSVVPLELVLPGVAPNVVLSGTVIGLRPASERFGEGVFLRLEAKELEKCRALLGLLPASPGTETGRRTVRVDCNLQLRFAVPQLPLVAEAKNLSETGLLAKVSQTLIVGQRATVRLILDERTELFLDVEVSWSRPEIQLVGMEFLNLDRNAAEIIRAFILKLRRADASDRSNVVLLVDDDPISLEMFGGALTDAGYTVRKSARGDEALQLIRKLKPKLAVLDVVLPGLDGKDVCKRVRADAEMVSTQVVLISGLDAPKLHSVAQEAGATDYLSKPLTPEELLRVVRRYVGAP